MYASKKVLSVDPLFKILNSLRDVMFQFVENRFQLSML